MQLISVSSQQAQQKIKLELYLLAVTKQANMCACFVLVYYNETRADIEQKLTQVDIRAPSIE